MVNKCLHIYRDTLNKEADRTLLHPHLKAYITSFVRNCICVRCSRFRSTLMIILVLKSQCQQYLDTAHISHIKQYIKKHNMW